MGAQLSSVAPTATVAIDAYVAELGDLAWAADMGRGSRFLKTVRAVHRDGHAVIKVFIKPPALIVDLEPARRMCIELSARLKSVPNAIGYKRIVDTERAGYLVRQYIKHNLYDRISTRPFLELGEKLWLSYQLLRCLSEAHALGVCHGDLKTENVLVNSWKWVYVVDWAPYKPVQLPETDTAPFLFYFDTSQRRTCYVAPERFTDAVSTDSVKLDPAMDVYSAGCVIAELFCDGVPPFTLADLVKYKRGKLQPNLEGIERTDVRELVASMISLEPVDRPSAAECLQCITGLFPAYFGELFELFAPLSGNLGNADSMVEHVWNSFGTLLKLFGADIDTSLQKMSLGETSGGTSPDWLPVHVRLPGLGDWVPQDTPLEDRTGALLVLSFLCSTLRSTTVLRWRLRAAELVLALSAFVGDESRLDRSLPYLVGLSRDEQPAVREASLTYVTHLLGMVSTLTPLNRKVYSEYVFPRLSQAMTQSDTAASTRAVWAACLSRLSEYAAAAEPLESVLPLIDEAARSLLVDKNAIVRQSLLAHAAPLCAVLGRQRTTDLVLSHAITYLNDKSAAVRIELFSFVAQVAPLVGPASLEQYVVPLMVQSLADPREDVVAAVLNALASLVELGLVRERLLLGTLIPATVRFLVHPSIYIRSQTVQVVVHAARQLDAAQVWCLLRPQVLPLLEVDVPDLRSASQLVQALRAPILPAVYALAQLWASQARKSAFWSSSSATTAEFSAEDKGWLTRLRDVGFNNEDLWQLLVFRDYLSQVLPESSDFAAADNGVSSTMTSSLDSDLAVDLDAEAAAQPGDVEQTLLSKYLRQQQHSIKPATLKPQKTVICGRSLPLLDLSSQQHSQSTSSSSTSSSVTLPSQPQVLVASIKAHRGAVLALATAANQQTFATGADDGLIKVWDAHNLARGASRPSATLDMGSRISSATFVGRSLALAVGMADGTARMLEVKAHTSETGQLVYDSIVPLGETPGGAKIIAVTTVATPAASLWLLRADCTLTEVDLATLEIRRVLQNPVEYGPPTCWVFDPIHADWAAVGTSRGVISLWDLRFGLCVASWGVGDMCALTAMSSHPSNPLWVCVAGGFSRPLVSAWDVRKSECRELCVPAADGETTQVPSQTELEPRKIISGQFADWSLSDNAISSNQVTAIASSKPNVMLTGGGDLILRYWDLAAPNRCAVVSGLVHTQPHPSYTGRVGATVKTTLERPGAPRRPERFARTVVIANEERDIGRNHRGTIARVALLAGQREMVVSTDEVGVVKIYI